MKLLKKIKIINWHYFWNETIDIEPIVFLTGLNGSGKSTLIDAFEVVLLGDTTGRSFNKAALDKSSRTLKGYLKGELGDEIEGGFKYLRNGRFTSYIALEFFDDVKTESFTLGAVFDCFEDNSEEHHFFTIDDKIPENEFIVDNVPLEFKALQKYLASDYQGKYKFFTSNREYQEYLKKALGGLKDKYFSLLKKATSFSPITDIRTFITEYVCDPQKNLDLSKLQDNILQYRKLQVESENIKKRLEKLETISTSYFTYLTHKENFDISRYLIEFCELKNSEEKLKAFKDEIVKANNRISEIDEELADFKDNLATLEKRKISLIEDKMHNDVAKLTEELLKERKDTSLKIKEYEKEIEEAKSSLFSYLDTFFEEANKLTSKLNEVDKDALDEEKEEDVLNIELNSKKVVDFIVKFKSKLNEDKDLSKDDFFDLRKVLKDFKDSVSTLAISLSRTTSNISKKIQSLKEEEVQIKKGSKPFDNRLVAIKTRLKDELQNKFNKKIDVELYCDLVDIKDESWSNVIEGYLYSQKFNLFVAPKYYLDAYKILRRLLEEYRFYQTALIDQEKIIERGYEIENGSLAEEIVTEHEGARSYTNFLIGRLYKAENEAEARESGNGITRECDLYRNFTLSRINPRLYQESYIGKDLGERFLKEKRDQMEKNISTLNSLKEISSLINDANNLEVVSVAEIDMFFNSLEKGKEIDGLKQNLEYLENELKEHDQTLILSLDKRIEDVESDVKELNDKKDEIILEKGNLLKVIESLKDEKILAEEKLINDKKDHLDTFDKVIIEKANEIISFKEDSNYFEILKEANANLSRLQYLYNNLFSNLCKLRREYVHDYHLSYDPDKEDNKEFEDELNDFKNVKLPQYNEQIHDAYLKATQQFKDDFIFKLRAAIEEVEDQIESLNEALVESEFGNDSYRFTVKPSSQFKRYYDMLKDDIILEGGEDESAFLNKYKDVMEDLFRQIVDVGDKADNQEILENINRFTDYRSYLDFDLIVYNNKSKEEQRLSKMIKKKSGGETQTPFYIAVLASFAQLYHVHEEGEIANTSRLIIFDEAFSKMDRGRIKEAVKLLQKFNLQVIISCPTDKVADISELVDETLVVLHDRNSSFVRKFKSLS